MSSKHPTHIDISFNIKRATTNLKYYRKIFHDEVIANSKNLTRERLTALEYAVDKYEKELRKLKSEHMEFFI